MKTPIAYTRPSITELEISYVTDAVTHGWGPRCYEYIDRLEQQFAAYLGVNYAIATSSCTGALHLGLAAAGVGPGDEVIIADTNWIASVAPVVHLGATPVFVDILPDSWCLDPIAVASAITSKTKAIIAVHLYGNLCQMAELTALAGQHGLYLIEDAAEALGSEYHGKKTGSMGDFGVFSFHGTKTMTTGEGGMFVTNSADLYEKVLTLSNHGRRRGQPKQFWPDELGFKYKMSNIQAALGCAQLDRIEDLVGRKRAIFASYRQKLQSIAAVTLNPEPPDTINSAWMPTAVFSRESGVLQADLIAAFKVEHIDARVFFWPLSHLPAFAHCGYSATVNPIAYDIYQRAINLPSFVEMSEIEVDRVCDVVRELVRLKGGICD
jgi:perosamine synthetase